MKRITAPLMLLILVVVLAGTAAAQTRDPFDPVQSEGSSESSGGGGESSGAPFDPATAGDTGGDSGQTADPGQTGGSDDVGSVTTGSDSLPVTGGDPTSWLMVAYGLIGTGAALLVMDRVRRPLAAR